MSYVSILFLKISDEYYAMDAEERVSVTRKHVSKLGQYEDRLTHILTSGFSGKWDQINLLEADDLETLYRMTEDFRFGAKARYIQIVDAAVGIRVDNKREFNMVGSR